MPSLSSSASVKRQRPAQASRPLNHFHSSTDSWDLARITRFVLAEPKEFPVIVEVDLLGEVVLLVDSAFQVRDVFVARGPTRHESSYPIVFYTYRKLLTPVGQCAVCGYALEQLNEPCSASGGFHAFVGLAGESDVPELHKAEARALDLRRISYDEFDFYVEADNLFPVDQITQGFEV